MIHSRVTAILGTIIAVIILLGCSSPAPPESQTAVTPAVKQPAQTEIQKPQARIGDTPEGILAVIESNQEVKYRRLQLFELLKEKYPAEALAFARRKAYENPAKQREQMGALRAQEILNIMFSGEDDLKSLCVRLVLENGMRNHTGVKDKVRYFIKTVSEIKRGFDSSGLLEDYCKEVDAGIGYDFTPDQDSWFMSFCKETCDLNCLETIWDRHKDDWTNPGISLKKEIYSTKCRDYKICNVDAFLKRLSEPDDPKNEVHFHLMHFLALQPWAHCIPYDEMLKMAEKNGNAVFIDALIKSEHKYRSKQSGYCDTIRKPPTGRKGK